MTMHQGPRTRGLAVTFLLVGLTAFPGAVGATGAAAVAAAPAPDGGPELKPFAAGAVSIDPASVAGGSVDVEVDPTAGLTGASVTVSGTGDVQVGPADRGPLPEAASTVTAPVAIAEETPADDPSPAAAVGDATGTTVVATLTGTVDGVSRSSSDIVWVDAFAGETLVSELGEQDLRLQRVEVLRSTGAVTPEAADALVEEILGATDSTEAVAEGGCVDVCVAGLVRWTDAEGGTHPVDRAPVEIRDAEPGADEVVTTVTTGADGSYAAQVDNIDGDATGRDLYIRVLADGPGFTLNQHVDSGVTTDAVTGSSLTKNVTANNVTDNNTAFSVHAALVYASDFITTQNGGPLPTVPVVFPSDGSYYDGTAFNLLALDRWDWDVALHEFGHYVADELNIENNPGGPHSSSQNLSDSRGSKSIGVRLAFGEGWPTFFAVSALQDLASGAGVPNVGDTQYQDTEDLVITNDLEVNATLGEDNERTVMNILWDLYDVPDDGLDTVVLGSATVWDVLDAGDPETLSAAYLLFSPGRAEEDTNCVFTQMNVAPKLRGSSVNVVPEDPPALSWRRGNGGTHRNNLFTVKFRGADGSLLFRTPARTTNSFTPGAARWDAIVADAGGIVRVTVVGTQTDAPRTGPYQSCPRRFGAL